MSPATGHYKIVNVSFNMSAVLTNGGDGTSTILSKASEQQGDTVSILVLNPPPGQATLYRTDTFRFAVEHSVPGRGNILYTKRQ